MDLPHQALISLVPVVSDAKEEKQMIDEEERQWRTNFKPE